MLLAGRFEQTIDSKNRLSIPFAIRQKLDPEDDGHSFYVLPGERVGTLALYAAKYFERSRPAVPEHEASPETYEWRQFEYSQSALLDPDSQGRVLIPEHLLKRAGIGREVMLTGAEDHLLLWDRKRFEEFENSQWDRFQEKRSKAMAELRTRAAARSTVDGAAH
jgi:MraZ protein